MNAMETDFDRLDRRTLAFLERTPAHFINGSMLAPAAGGTIPMLDPSSGKAISAIAAGTAGDLTPPSPPPRRRSRPPPGAAWSPTVAKN
jgi:hypothetical protein